MPMSHYHAPTDSDRPIISVVVPTCNRCDVFARCLEALADQTWSSYEVIVVDDGSTDETPTFLRDFGADHERLKLTVLRNDSNIGANPSRNRGVRAAVGEFVAFIDSDAIAKPDWLEKLVEGFISRRVAAVTGLVRDLPPTNVYELAFKGTHRIHGAGEANRLSAGNMCIRRDLLTKHMLDEDRASVVTGDDGKVDVTVSGRGDEEGLYLHLKAAGYEQRVVPDAEVLHIHHYTRRSFFKQAYRGGKSAARLVYKFHLPPRVDMIPFVLTYVSVPLVLLGWRWGYVSAFFFAAAITAITYNDLVRKGKTLGETIRSFPVLLIYYHVRLAGYVLEAIRLRLGLVSVHRVRLASSVELDEFESS